jgi:enoyl-CoA hydratase
MRWDFVDDIGVLRMEAGKANAIGHAFLGAFEGRLDELEGRRCSAIVITGESRFFCAGLALPELIELDRSAMEAFIVRFGRLMRRVFTLPWPTVACINGHAVAGGCVLALQCDRRVMGRDAGKIGLNEVALGISLPPVVIETLRAAVPPASLVPIALRAELLGPADAYAIGLVDRVVESATLEREAVVEARALGAAPRSAYAQTKRDLRAPFVDRIDATERAGTAQWLDQWFGQDAQVLLRAAVARLTA